MRIKQPADEAYIYATWLNSFEPHRDRRVTRDVYYVEQHALVKELLASDQILVAVDPTDESLIFGWLAGAELPVGRVLDYVFTKSHYRRVGVARGLLDVFGAVDAYTHLHPIVSAKLTPGATFDPYLLCLARHRAKTTEIPTEMK